MDNEIAKKYIKACGYKIIEENIHFIRIKDKFNVNNTTLCNKYGVYLPGNSNDLIFINVETERAFIINEKTIQQEISKNVDNLPFVFKEFIIMLTKAFNFSEISEDNEDED